MHVIVITRSGTYGDYASSLSHIPNKCCGPNKRYAAKLLCRNMSSMVCFGVAAQLALDGRTWRIRISESTFRYLHLALQNQTPMHRNGMSIDCQYLSCSVFGTSYSAVCSCLPVMD